MSVAASLYRRHHHISYLRYAVSSCYAQLALSSSLVVWQLKHLTQNSLIKFFTVDYLSSYLSCTVMKKDITVGVYYDSLLILKKAVVRHLGYFLNLQIVLEEEAQRAEMPHCAKFCENWSIRYGNIAVFDFFQDSGHPPSWIC